MACSPFRLAWFLQGSSIQAWGSDWTGNISEEWMDAGMFLDLARNIERAGFDYLLLEDSIYVGQNWQDKRDIFLKNGMSIPRQEPSVIASLMARAGCAGPPAPGAAPAAPAAATHVPGGALTRPGPATRLRRI